MKGREELAVTMGESSRREDAEAPGVPCPGLLGAPYSEAWGYFHLAPARVGHPSGHWATCRLCGEQVGRGPGFQAGTSALWRHLKNAHQWELEKSGARRSSPAPSCPLSNPAAAAEGDWAHLLEQMRALAVRCSRRERELERREAAVELGERALERRRRELQERSAPRFERAASSRLREKLCRRGCGSCRSCGKRGIARAPCTGPPRRPPFKEEAEEGRDGCVVTKVLL
uniref:BED-type domain-containing protein n=1 Tax=Sciurus vulgaris TaxID=55149 RepID=A0A8D2ASY1_SCIVU